MNIEYPEIRMTEDGFHTLYSKRYGQTYHSIHGVLQEAQHVFIDGCRIERLLDERRQVDILEVGFGTGFNFLLSASRALEFGKALHYTALENDLPDPALMRRLNHRQLPHIRPLRARLWRELEVPVLENPLTVNFGNNLILTLFPDDATRAVLEPEAFDAVFLDAFSPDSNPDLWTEKFMKKLFNALKPGGILGTYSSRGPVRRALRSAGFDVHKRPGPPGKREVLSAVKPFSAE